MSYSFNFIDTPSDVLRPLLMGYCGTTQLLSVAEAALAHADNEAMRAVALDALLSAWGENPFDGRVVGLLASRLDALPAPDGRLLPLLKLVLSTFRPDESDEVREALAAPLADRLAFFSAWAVQSPENMFWWKELFETARLSGNWAVVVETIGRANCPADAEPLFDYAKGSALLALSDPAAEQPLTACTTSFPLPTVEERIAEVALRAGESGPGRERLQQCVMRQPWNVTLWQRLNDMRLGGCNSNMDIGGSTTIFLYTRNRAEMLDATLQCLAASDLGQSRICLLDHGSTDGTPDVLKQFVETMGERASVETLPVEIGGPAARNWLMEKEIMQSSDNVVFMADDISVPVDWMGRLGVAVSRYPAAGVWGAKVVSAANPSVVLAANRNLSPTRKEREAALVRDCLAESGDFGQADCVRPCASVSGALHLFKRERLLETGGFDLRFSPDSLGDLDRDLRMVETGGYAVCSGCLSVTKQTSDAGTVDAQANMRKLAAKQNPASLETMAAHMEKVLRDDLMNKMAIFM